MAQRWHSYSVRKSIVLPEASAITIVVTENSKKANDIATSTAEMRSLIYFNAGEANEEKDLPATNIQLTKQKSTTTCV
jgi:hypothetical protein